MAVPRGRHPKPAHLRQNRTKKAGRATLEHPGGEVTRDLPELGGREWHPLTLAWWQRVWESPMAELYLPTDVDGLVRLAMMVDDFYHDPNPKILAEIRLQEARFGLSPLDRSRLQWEVQRGEEADRKRRPKPVETPQSQGEGGDPRAVLKVVK